MDEQAGTTSGVAILARVGADLDDPVTDNTDRAVAFVGDQDSK